MRPYRELSIHTEPQALRQHPQPHILVPEYLRHLGLSAARRLGALLLELLPDQRGENGIDPRSLPDQIL